MFWRYDDEIRTQVPRRPVAVVHQDELRDHAAPADRLYFWSPAVERSAGMTARLCARWPQAALYTVVDRAGLSSLHAASPAGSGWVPACPRPVVDAAVRGAGP